MRKLGKALCIASLAMCGAATTAAASDERDELLFGVVPQQSASRLAKIWTPFLKHVGDGLGRSVSFATAKDIPTFEACLAKGAYDLAYMNPYHYTTFSTQSGYEAFARQEKKQLKGLLVVRADSPIERLEDLKGATIAFPSPAAFGASVIPRAELSNRGIEFEPKYVRSHDSVYRAVAAGLMPAGGGVLRTFGHIPDTLRSQLRVLYRTDGYTPHAFAAHPRVSNVDVQAIARLMIAAQDARPELMELLGMPGVQGAQDADWNDVRELGLTQAETSVVVAEAGKCRSG